MTDGPELVGPPVPPSPRSAKRRMMFITLAGILAVVGTLVGAYYFAMRPVTLRIAAAHVLKAGDVAPPLQDCARPYQAASSWLAIVFIAFASAMSSAVTPPASWVARTTSTVL